MMASESVRAVMRIDNGQLIMDNAGKMIVYVEVVMSAFSPPLPKGDFNSLETYIKVPFREDLGGYCCSDTKIRLILLFAKLNC